MPLQSVEVVSPTTPVSVVEKAGELARGSVVQNSDEERPQLDISWLAGVKAFFFLRKKPLLLGEGKVPEYRFPITNHRCCRGSCCCEFPFSRASGSCMSRTLAALFTLNGLFSLLTTWTDWDPFNLDAVGRNEILGRLCIVPDIENNPLNVTDYIPSIDVANATRSWAKDFYYATQATYDRGFDIYDGTGTIGDPSNYTWPNPYTGSGDAIDAELTTSCEIVKCFVGSNGLLNLGLDCITFVDVPCGDLDRVETLQENKENEILLSSYDSTGSNATFNASIDASVEDEVYRQFTIFSNRLTTGTSIYPLYSALMIFLAPGYLVVGGGWKYQAKSCINSINKAYFAIFVTLLWYFSEYLGLLSNPSLFTISGLQGLSPTVCYAAADGYVEELEAQAAVCDLFDEGEFYVEQGIDSVNYYSTVESTYETPTSPLLYAGWSANISYYQNLLDNSTTFDCDLEGYIDGLNEEFGLSLSWVSLRLIYKAVLPIIIAEFTKKTFQLLEPLSPYNGRITLAENIAGFFQDDMEKILSAKTSSTGYLLGERGGLSRNADDMRTKVEKFIWIQSLLPCILYGFLIGYIIADLSR